MMTARQGSVLETPVPRSWLLLALLGLWELSPAAASCSDPGCRCVGSGASVAATCEISSLQELSDLLAGFVPQSLVALTLSCKSKDPGSLPDAIFDSQRRLSSLAVLRCSVLTVGGEYLSGLDDLETLIFRDLDLSADVSFDLPLVTSHASKLRVLVATNCGINRVPSLCSFQHLREVNISGNQISSWEDTGLACGNDVTSRSADDAANDVNAVSSSAETSSLDTSAENSSSSEEIPSTQITLGNGNRSSSTGNSNDAVSDVIPASVSSTTTEHPGTSDVMGQRGSMGESDSSRRDLSRFADLNLTVPNILQSLDLSSNPIASLPDWFVATYTQLRSLRLAGTLITAVPDRLLSRMPHLELLDCFNCPLQGALPLGSNSALQTLRLSAFNADLPAGVLSQLPSLVTLELEGVGITTTVFRELEGRGNLTSLALRRVGLTDLDPRVTSTMPELQVLDVSGNSIADLDGTVFAFNGQLRTLNLSGNSLQTLPLNVLDSLTLLRVLDLRANALVRLASSTFQNTSSLEELHLASNKLGFLPTETFKNLSLVHSLDLMANEMVSIPDFTGLTGLLYLDISDNKIITLRDDAFEGLPELWGVTLRGNRLSWIPRDAFRTNRKLYLINLAFNQIRSIDTVLGSSRGPFTSLDQLEILRLDGNKLTDVKDYLAGLPKLRLLFLDNNRIEEIRSGDLPISLTSLSMANNSLTFIRDHAFVDLPNLELVDISSNYPYLKTFSQFAIRVHPRSDANFIVAFNLFHCDCNLAFLKALELARKARDKAIPVGMPTFLHLDLAFCAVYYDNVNIHRFNATPFSQFVCPYQEFCDLLCECCSSDDDCPCRMKCPEGCQCYVGDFTFGQKLHNDVFCWDWRGNALPPNVAYLASRLVVTGGNVSSLPDKAFVRLRKLEVLLLENSGIQSIQDEAFSGLEGLKRLSLAGNRLVSLNTEAFRPLQGLQSLSLHGNLLSRVDVSAMESFSNVSLHLSNNPWTCDCDFMQEFVEFVGHQAALIEDLNNLTCIVDNDTSTVNTSQSVIPVLEFSVHTMCASSSHQVNVTIQRSTFLDNKTHLAALITLLIALAIVGVLVGVIYWRRREIQALLFAHFGIRLPFAFKADDSDPQRVYDAFISYSSHDEAFVLHELMPRLEGGDRKYRLCLHFRDFPVGASIADTIIESIEASKRTVLLLSRHFLSSEWCSFERQTAHHHALKQGEHRLILVVLEDLTEAEIEPELGALLKGGATTLRVEEPLFWEKLCLALPDVPTERRHNRQDAGNHATEMKDQGTPLATENGDKRMANVV